MMINQVTVFHPKYNQRLHKDTSGVDTVPAGSLNIKMAQTRLAQLMSGLVAAMVVIWTCSVCFQLIHQMIGTFDKICAMFVSNVLREQTHLFHVKYYAVHTFSFIVYMHLSAQSQARFSF